MDFIPTFRFIVSLIMFGLCMYVYKPVIEYLNETFPTSGPYATAMFFIWGILSGVVLLGSGIKLVMDYQRNRGS